MSFIDLATITMHRRNELESRINQFSEKCDLTINQIIKMKAKAQGFVLQLNCDPSELKDRFLSCMKHLDEFMYLLTDFNLAASQIDCGSADSTPILDTSQKGTTPQLLPFNLLDVLSEPTPSTSRTIQSPQKPQSIEVTNEQTLIQFSSSSCSSESVPKSEMGMKKMQNSYVEQMNNMTLYDSHAQLPVASDPCKLPAQKVLQVEQIHTGTIMHIDGAYFWVIMDDVDEIYGLMIEMTEYYKENHKSLSLEEVQSLAYCAFFEDNCYYRGLFLNVNKEDKNIAEVFLVDTGETRCAPISDIQPLAPRFCEKPPFARCCHLAGVDLLYYNNNDLMEKFEEFMKSFVGEQCGIEIDDNSSESLGVYAILLNKEILNNIVVKQGLAYAKYLSPADKATPEELTVSQTDVATDVDQELSDIAQCPEYEDPVEAVTGYHNRDEADICKHYKGGPEKTCFKGSRCTKRHVLKHPDGWTLDRVAVPAKCHTLPLPEPGTWHKVLVTCVCHFDKVYVQFVNNKNERDTVPDAGVNLPPMSLSELVSDMNSATARQSYKTLQMGPASGELVAALYPYDNNWYRAMVISQTGSDQSIEVIYIDYGTRLWVKEDHVRVLERQYMLVPIQAIQCALAGVLVKSHCSRDWGNVKKMLTDIVQDHEFKAHIISRDYDKLVVELYNDKGVSVAEQMAVNEFVHIEEFTVQHDTNLTHKIVVP